MSVYIPNMEMPTSPVLFCIHPDGKVFADLEGGWREYKVVPIPPHGDLIDADKLVELCDIMAEKCDGIGVSIWHQFKTTVEWSPIVIQASEEGE